MNFKAKIKQKKEKVKKMEKKIYQKSRIFLLNVIKKWRKTNLRCKLHKFFTVKNFSKGDIIVLSMIVISGAILYTPLWKFIFFVLITDASWISGRIGYKKIREKLEKAERIIENPNIPISKKYVEAVSAVHAACDQLGRVMDRFNLKQGTAPYLRSLEKEMGGEKKR